MPAPTDDLVTSSDVRTRLLNATITLTIPIDARSDMGEYHQYYPAGAPPDMVALTYEPNHRVSVGKFLRAVRPFHDEFATETSPFLLARAAPNVENISENNRIAFLNVITHKKVVNRLPYYIGATYYNFNDAKADKRIVTLQREPALEVGTKASMNRKVSSHIYIHLEAAVDDELRPLDQSMGPSGSIIPLPR